MPKYANVDLRWTRPERDVNAIPCEEGYSYLLPGSRKFNPRDGQPVRILQVRDEESRLRLATRFFLLDFDLLPSRLEAMKLPSESLKALVLYDPKQMPSIPGTHFLFASR